MAVFLPVAALADVKMPSIYDVAASYECEDIRKG